ncbi:MAG: hypothetical protein K6T66_08035 [Peptococcaceae bacterium]|nr:hypothetical protein [Peptococcaceae bacterium]
MPVRMKKGWLAAAAALIMFFGAVMAGTAGNSEPGSPEDPLVTRSYVDAQLNLFADRYMQWQVVDLSAGQQVIGAAGTELIVRVGEMAVIDSTGNGIPDLTGGVNIAAGQRVAPNHHLIIPRSDGRGIAARSKGVVMYKGEIKVK